jgi:beta-lactam-binding protein with PASTA domain
VPNVVGLDQQSAASRLRQSDLAPGNIGSRAAPQPAGTVIEQQPSACSDRPESNRVSLVVSTGPRTSETPQAEGGRGSGTSVGDVAVPIAIGVGVAVVGGILARRRDNLVEVPDLLTKPIAAATATLKSSRLRMGEVARAESLSAPPETIFEQVPAAGTRVVRDSVVNVRVSSGRPMTEVPNVTLRDWRDAEAVVASARLRPLTINPPAGDPSGLVVESQVPAPGTRVIVGATVGITLRARAQAAVIDPAPPADVPPPAPVPANPGAVRVPARPVPIAPAPTAPPPATPAPPALAPPIADAIPPTPIQPPPTTRPPAPPLVQAPASAPFAILTAVESAWPWLWLLLLIAVGLLLWRHARRPPVPPIVPRVVFVPRLDAGCQVITTIGATRGRTFDFAMHIDAGIQQVQFDDVRSRVVEMRARS